MIFWNSLIRGVYAYCFLYVLVFPSSIWCTSSGKWMDWDLLNQQIPWMAMGVIVFVVCMIGLDMSRAFVRMHSVYAVRKCSVALFVWLSGFGYQHGYTCRPSPVATGNGESVDSLEPANKLGDASWLDWLDWSGPIAGSYHSEGRDRVCILALRLRRFRLRLICRE